MYKPIEKNIIINLDKCRKMQFLMDEQRPTRAGFFAPYKFVFGEYIVAKCYIRWIENALMIDDLDITAPVIKEPLSVKEMNYILGIKALIRFLKKNDLNIMYVYYYGEKWSETFIDHGFSINKAPDNMKGRYEAKLDLTEKIKENRQWNQSN